MFKYRTSSQKSQKSVGLVPKYYSFFSASRYSCIKTDWRNTMTDQAIIDLDYEHLDDLPLSDHFEWRYLQVEKTDTDDSDDEQVEWQAA